MQTNQTNQTQTGLYFNGNIKAANYNDAIKVLYQLNSIPKLFCIDEDHKANGYSVIDNNGVQHIYDLSPKEFYGALINLD